MSAPKSVGIRAILLGCGVGAALALANPYGEFVARTWSIGAGSLPGGVVFALFLLVSLNRLLMWLSPRRALTRGELLVAYGTAIISYPLTMMYLPHLIGTLSFAFYRASPENNWESLIWPHVPAWSRLGSARAVNLFWQGLSDGEALPWGDWVGPLAAWGVLTVAAMAAMFTLSALLSRDWIERQRLTFPLVDVPLAIVGEEATPTLGRSIFRNRVFWVGFLIPATILLLLWLGAVFPAIPAPALDHQVGRSLAGKGLPWSALSNMRIRIYFSVIGVACLVPGEVSLSIWLFYVLYCIELLVLASLGITHSSSAVEGLNPRSFIGYAEAGGFVALAAAVLWQSRGTLREAGRGLLRGGDSSGDLSAPLSGRAALLGFLAANGVMFWWVVRAGMSWWTFAIWAMLTYAVLIGCSRLVAAAGVMRADSPAALYPFPREAMVRTLGAAPIGASSLAVMGYISIAYMGNVENSPMSQMVNSFKLVRSERLRGTRFTWAAAVVCVVVLVVGSVSLLEASYRNGASTLVCWPVTGAATCAFRQLESSLRSPESPSNWLRGAMAGGAGLTLLLVWLSTRFVWWPVSPVGFIMASAFYTNYGLWFNTFVGWALATLVRHYGGYRLYRALRPAFLGLVLGEVLTRSALGLFSLVFGLNVPSPFPLA
jgi:hypothetical protein